MLIPAAALHGFVEQQKYKNMTTLLLTAQVITPRIGIRRRCTDIQERFLVVNRRGLVTMFLIGCLIAGIAGYVILLSQSFDLGMRLRGAGVSAAEEEREVKNLDVALREEEANFALRHEAALADMDTVSSVTYLESGSVALLGNAVLSQ